MGHTGQHTFPLPDGECWLMVAYFRLLSNFNDLQLIAAIGTGEYPVTELARRVNISQPLASRRLAYLQEGGLVRSRRDRRRKLYMVADPSVHVLCRLVHEIVTQKS